MRKLLLLSMTAATMLCISPARADTTFDASGVLADGAVLSGTVQINTTTGVFDSIDLTLGSPDANTYTHIYSQGADPGTTGEYLIYGTLASSPTTYPVLAFGLDDISLVGFTGGDFASEDDPSSKGYASVLYTSASSSEALISGELTLPAATTPEPSSFALLGTGLLGVAGFMKRRFV